MPTPSQPVRMVVHYDLWGRKSHEPLFTARDKGKQVGFNNLQQARDYATKQGYTGGIRLRSVGSCLSTTLQH